MATYKLECESRAVNPLLIIALNGLIDCFEQYTGTHASEARALMSNAIKGN